MNKEPNQRAGGTEVLRQRVTGRKAQLAAFHRGVRWLLRNTRRVFKLLGWLCTGQFGRAARAVLPYYQQYTPLQVKRMVPDRVRRAAQRWVMTEQPWNVKIDYAEWIVRNDTLSDPDRLLIHYHIASFKNKPKFSILMPVHNSRPDYLGQAIDSVMSQLYQDWELSIVGDASTKGKIRTIIEGRAQKDSRIRPHFRSTNGGVSAHTNTALEMATGDWIVLMNPDGVLSEHALYLVAEAVNSEPDAAIVYSDHDHIDAKGQRVNPYFKPDWDCDLFLGQNYINPLCTYRADLAHRVEGIREGFEGAQDWDFALRVLGAVPDAKVHHIPFVLYHQRATHGKFSKGSPASAIDAAQRAVNEHFKRTGRAAAAFPQGHSNYLRIKWSMPPNHPLVSIIVPTKDQCQLLQTCIDGLVNRTSYRPLEIIVVDNGSSEPDALAFLAEIQAGENVKVVEDSRPFNFSRLVNLGVTVSSGDICVLLNNDVDVINPDWLDEMVSHALRPEVGAVGAKLYYPNNTLQHGGVILGIAGEAGGHVHKFLPRKSPGYFNRLNLTHSLSAVTAACLAIRRDAYKMLGGFNENDLTICANDVDFCLRLRQAGYRIIWTPNAELYHHERVSRAQEATYERVSRADAERAYIRREWGPALDNDPYYNPNLSLDSLSFELAEMTRVHKPWLDFEFALRNNLKQEVVNTLQADAQEKMKLSVGNLIQSIPPLSAWRRGKGGKSQQPNKSTPALRYNPKLQKNALFLRYDVSSEILRKNWEVIERFREDPHLELNRALWILPAFDHIYRGGIYTIFRVADSFSRQFGTINTIALHGGANIALPEVQTMIRRAFPSLKFQLTMVRDLREADDLPPADAAFCTLWTTAYILVRYNKCKGKFYFVQDFEPAFSAAGSTYGLIEQTYRFGFAGVANTPGVGELYRQYNPWVQYFIPGVDKSIFYPEPERSAHNRIWHIVFYGRPRNDRNAFELGVTALSLVKNELGNAVEITSVGSDFAESEYGIKGILKNRGVLRSIEELAALYRSSDVGLVFMYTAHPSYQPFEFMASGCATVSNLNRYTQWFLRDGENAALTHSTPTCIAERILEVLQDEELRRGIVEGGLKTVSTLEWDAALERIMKFVCRPSPSRSQFLSRDMHLYGTTR